MAGSFDLDTPPPPLGYPAAQFAVFRYNPGAAAGRRFELLPNIVCEGVSLREGPHPGSAQCRYVFGSPWAEPDDPERIEDVYGLDSAGPGVLLPDDRLCVRRLRPDGSWTVAFDGFAQVPEAGLDAGGETVHFTVIGAPLREWDTPLAGAVYRDASHPKAGRDVPTGRPARFNPDGRANATDADAEAGTSPDTYPTFLDENVCKSRSIGRVWTIGMAARYLLAVGNPSETYVTNPDFADPHGKAPSLDQVLRAIEPTDPAGPVDLTDPSTYTLKDIPCQDIDVTGKAWPEALHAILMPHGFEMAFRLAADGDGTPAWSVDIYRVDGTRSVKTLRLQAPGSRLDPAQTNLGGLRLQRDASQLANRWYADTAPVRYEASFVLAPAFRVHFDSAHQGTGQDDTAIAWTNADDPAYRVWIFDEVGDGHWHHLSNSWSTDPTGLDAVLGAPTTDGDGRTTYRYAGRRRPGLATIHTRDHDGTRLKARLHVAAANSYNVEDPANVVPGIWNRANPAYWQEVRSDAWELLPDRLGIKLTVHDPKDWNIGKDDTAGAPFPTGKVNVPQSLAGPDDVNVEFFFRLTVVIEGDTDLGAVADRRPSSPTSYTVSRRDDTRDRYRKRVISASSYLNPDPSDFTLSGDDDTEAAVAHATARRRARETTTFAGTATIPRFTAAYRIGDKIKAVDGRGIDLQSNSTAGTTESPRWPSVVGLDWQLGDTNHSTILQLSDRRSEGVAAGHDVF